MRTPLRLSSRKQRPGLKASPPPRAERHMAEEAPKINPEPMPRTGTATAESSYFPVEAPVFPAYRRLDPCSADEGDLWMATRAYGAYAADKPLEPIDIDRREPGPNDIQIEIAFCGVCHSDLHTVRSEWGGTLYPCVPGHEIVGHVSAVGAEVSGFRVGDTVGVGCLVDSCRHCAACEEGLEQYCTNGFVGTYNGPTQDPPGHTLGGYSQRIVVDEKFVLRIRHPEDQLAAVAPLLCAGITTWSPLRHWQAGPGKKVGIVGIGGLGHMGIKLAHALGAHVVAFTTSKSKRQDALDRSEE